MTEAENGVGGMLTPRGCETEKKNKTHGSVTEAGNEVGGTLSYRGCGTEANLTSRESVVERALSVKAN